VINVAAAHLLMRCGLWYLAAQAFGIFIAWFVNYLAANPLVFPKIASTKPSSSLDSTN